MKPGLRAVLTSDVDPVFFVLTCFLLAGVLVSATVMADEVVMAQDGALLSAQYGLYHPELTGGLILGDRPPIPGAL